MKQYVTRITRITVTGFEGQPVKDILAELVTLAAHYRCPIEAEINGIEILVGSNADYNRLIAKFENVSQIRTEAAAMQVEEGILVASR